MTPVNAQLSHDRDAGVAAVEAWCAAHRALWETWTAAWARTTGYPLRIVGEADGRRGVAVAIEGGGQTFAMLTSDGHSDAFEPWLHGVAGLIGESLAMEGELNTMTDELVDSYDQLTFLYEIARMLSTTSTLSDALTMLLAQARHIIGADGGALVIEQPERPALVLTDGATPPE